MAAICGITVAIVIQSISIPTSGPAAYNYLSNHITYEVSQGELMGAFPVNASPGEVIEYLTCLNGVVNTYNETKAGQERHLQELNNLWRSKGYLLFLPSGKDRTTGLETRRSFQIDAVFVKATPAGCVIRTDYGMDALITHAGVAGAGGSNETLWKAQPLTPRKL